MNKRTVWWTTGAALLAAGALFWAFAPRPVEVETAAVAKGAFQQTVDEDGRTRLIDRYVVSAPLTGRIGRIALREGDMLSAGATLASLTPALPALRDDRSNRELLARVHTSEAALERSQARIERARVALEEARLVLRRTEQLARDGFVSQTKLDADRLAQQGSQRELDTALADKHVAEHDREQARAAASMATAGPGAVAPFVLRSPIAGQVLRLNQSNEADVVVGTPLLEIGDLRGLEVVADLLTTDAVQIRPGAPVAIERWGGPGSLAGAVRRVEPAAFTKVSALGVEEQRVRVVIDLTSPRETWQSLGDGFRVTVRVQVVNESDALQVPVSAVFPLPDGAGNGVFRVDAGRALLTPVEVAARNGLVAWVRSGLQAGQQVIVYPPAAVVDGGRVRPRKV